MLIRVRSDYFINCELLTYVLRKKNVRVCEVQSKNVQVKLAAIFTSFFCVAG